jgi:hypothetical protein
MNHVVARTGELSGRFWPSSGLQNNTKAIQATPNPDKPEPKKLVSRDDATTQSLKP